MGFFKKKGPPNASDVAKRARVLAQLIKRSASCPPSGVLAQLKVTWSGDDWQKFSKEMESVSTSVIGTMKSEGIWDAATKSEQRMLVRPPHVLSDQDVINVSWRNEALRTLLWTLGKFDSVGIYDRETPVESTVRLCLDSVDPAQANLRPIAEIEHQREIAESWHWRSRTRALQEGKDPIPLPPGITIKEIIKMSAESMVERNAFPSALGDDFPALGKPYRDLTDDEWTLVRSITMERHFALNWVCGMAPKNDWDRTPTNT